MVDSLPPSGTDPDNQTIITNSNGKLSVPLDGGTLAVGSSGKVQVFGSRVYLADFKQDPGDWTGIENDKVSNGYASVFVSEDELPRSASVTADLTDIDVLNFRIDVHDLKVKIKFDGDELAKLYHADGYQTVEVSGLDDFGTNTTVTIEAYEGDNGDFGAFVIDYVRGNIIQPDSRIIELVDTGGLE